MEDILKLRSRKSDFKMHTEESTPNRLVLIKEGQSPFVDKLKCIIPNLWSTVFPYTLSTTSCYRICTTQEPFVDPEGGPLLQKGTKLDDSIFFKHKVDKPTETQRIGCEKCVSEEKNEETVEYVEKDKIVVDIIQNELLIILLKQSE